MPSRQSIALAAAGLAAVFLLGAALRPAVAAASSEQAGCVLLRGSTTASYFWDDSSGRAGDTGLPAGGQPMRQGMAASPSWPLGTEGYVTYRGQQAPFFVGDRGPGEPSSRGIGLDLDGKTFAALTGGRWDSDTLTVRDAPSGHIRVSYIVTRWGVGPGLRDTPQPFASGAWRLTERSPAAISCAQVGGGLRRML